MISFNLDSNPMIQILFLMMRKLTFREVKKLAWVSQFSFSQNQNLRQVFQYKELFGTYRECQQVNKDMRRGEKAANRYRTLFSKLLQWRLEFIRTRKLWRQCNTPASGWSHVRDEEAGVCNHQLLSVVFCFLFENLFLLFFIVVKYV